MIGHRVLVMTALPVERRAVVECLKEQKTCVAEDGTRYTRGLLTTPGGKGYDVWVATCDDVGNSVTAAQTSRSLLHAKPRYAFFVGVAGSLKEEAELGDVVFATHVYGYETAAARDSGWKSRPRVFEASHSLVQAAQSVQHKDQWCDGLETGGRRPTVHLKPIASGEKVHKDSKSELAAFIRNHYNDAIAVEMEGRGFYDGLRHDPPVMGAVIRGISDCVDDKEFAHDRVWQPQASRNGARFMVALLEELAESDGGAAGGPGCPFLVGLRYLRNPRFHGRENELQRLAESLTAGRPVVVVGEGGVGKTQLAVEYVYRHLSDYNAVYWLEAEEEANLSVRYANLATSIHDFTYLANAEQQVVIKAVRQWLTEHDRWLLVLDNARSPTTIQPYLPQGGGHVLITSRNPSWGHLGQILRLNLWSRAESVAFLLKRTESKDQASAHKIADLLGDLPLALNHAAAYVEATGCFLAEYLGLLATEGLGLLDDTAVVREHDAVGATWRVALSLLQDESPEANLLMRLLAFLAPEGLPISMMVAGASALDDPLKRVLSTVATANRLVALLRYHGLVSRAGEIVSVHRVLQHVIRASLDDSTKRSVIQEGTRLIKELFPYHADDPRHWDECKTLVPHVRAVESHALKTGVAPEAATALNQAGLYLMSSGAYAEAERFFLRALEIAKSTMGPEHPDVASCYTNLGELKRITAHYDEAEELLRRALQIGEKTLGVDHPTTINRLNNLALAAYGNRRYEQAEELLRRALKTAEATLGPEDPLVSTLMSNLAGVLRTTGRYPEAEKLFRRALEIAEKSLGPTHPSTAIRLNNLAGVLQDMKRYGEAERLYRRAVQIGEKILGSKHPNLATWLRNLGGLLTATGDYDEAEPLCRRALAIDMKSFGPSNPSAARSANNLAALLEATGRTSEASDLRQQFKLPPR